MSETSEALRAAREASGLSLAAMAARTHYSKPYLGMIETGDRKVSAKIIAAYERVLGVGLDDMNRRSFIAATALAAFAPGALSDELAASISGRDSGPLLSLQTSYETDRAVASLLDSGRNPRPLVNWMSTGESAVLRVNATGILAKLPRQGYAGSVVSVLRHDDEVRDRYLTAVVSRVLGTSWKRASEIVSQPLSLPYPTVAAERFAREVSNPYDSGARWCSAEMLQRLSPRLGEFDNARD